MRPVHLKGQPARLTRRILKRMSEEWDLPVGCSSTATRGRSGSLPPLPTAPSKRRTSNTSATPTATYLGITADDIEAYDLPSDDLSRGTRRLKGTLTRGSPTDGGKIINMMLELGKKLNSNRWPNTVWTSSPTPTFPRAERNRFGLSSSASPWRKRSESDDASTRT